MTRNDQRPIKSEVLADWYFRLNGVFTISNFVLHPGRPGSAQTDADIAGVRFPFRAEFGVETGLDDEWFESHSGPCAILAEVKTSMCAINGPWSNPADENIAQVLADLGWFPKKRIPQVAASLYQTGAFGGENLAVSLFCVGETTSEVVASRYSVVPQRTWSQIVRWIFDRFAKYRQRKTDHSTWDEAGRTLWDLFEAAEDADLFEESVRKRFLLRVA